MYWLNKAVNFYSDIYVCVCMYVCIYVCMYNTVDYSGLDWVTVDYSGIQ